MKKRLIRLCCLIAILIGTLVLVAGIVFVKESAQTKHEWASKMPDAPRSMKEVRGLVDNLIRYRRDPVPSFVPQAGWDNQLCSANIIGAVNFLMGEDLLTMAKAWEFSQTNADRIVTVYDRSRDFEEKDGRIIEMQDRDFWLSRILTLQGRNGSRTSDRLYVVGYHYHHTESDAAILAYEADWNSHLMLILGRKDGTWWGYHMLHDPINPTSSPFRIDSLSEEMPDWFDLVYIWEVKDTVMPINGDPVRLVQNSPAFREVQSVVGRKGSGTMDYRLDTLKLGLWGNGDSFPTIVRTDETVTLVPSGRAGSFHGELLGAYNGVEVRQHFHGNERTEFGQSYQCVELANRFLVEEFGHRNLQRTGHADTYYYQARGKGLTPFPNGSSEPPRTGDLIVFDPTGEDETPGHVAVVTLVDDDRVCVVQQNVFRWNECLPMEHRDGGWHVESSIPDLPCTGWSRP